MFHKSEEQWNEIKESYRAYWNKENENRPLLFIQSPVKNAKYMTLSDNLEKRWFDVDHIIEVTRNNMMNTYYAGEGYPYYMPNLGPDILGAILGCDLKLGEHTTWADHFVKDWSDVAPFIFDKNNKWWQKIYEMTERFVEDAKNGDYIVGLTDLHPGLDALVALRGTEALCIDLIDRPEEIKKRLDESFSVYKQVLDPLFDLVRKYQGGTTHWMDVWHDGRWNNTSCDFMCVISGSMFDDFVKPELQLETALLDATIFHLDGVQAARHVDKLLEMESINGIQWVFGAGSPTASHWLPLLKKIQDAGKNLHIDVRPDEVEYLCSNLRPEGVIFKIVAGSVEEADYIVRTAEQCYINNSRYGG